MLPLFGEGVTFKIMCVYCPLQAMHFFPSTFPGLGCAYFGFALTKMQTYCVEFQVISHVVLGT